MSLLELVRRYTEMQPGGSPFRTPVPGLIILRADQERLPAHLVFKPSLCITVQGSKWSTFGQRRYEYGAGQALVVSVEMPAMSRVAQASPGQPYLGVIIEFDLAAMHEMLERLGAHATPHRGDSDHPGDSHVDDGHADDGNAGEGAAATPGVFVTHFDGPLADCALRMVRLLDTPSAIPFIAPLVMREICYWLLAGPQGSAIARIALANSHARRVINAIHVLRDRFTQAVSVDELAAVAQMSASAFHRQFKALTSMTPLQYQKQLRLLEARNRMLSGAANAESAAYQVGYKSPSQFSREYARMFGAPPRRDIEAVKEAGSRARPGA